MPALSGEFATPFGRFLAMLATGPQAGMLSWVAKGGGGTMKTFVNGVPGSGAAYAGSIGTQTNQNYIIGGTWYRGSDPDHLADLFAWNGTIKNLKIFSTQLSDDVIANGL